MKIHTNKGISGKYQIRTYHPGTKTLKWKSPWMNNLIVNSENRGINLVLRRMIGQKTHDIEITSAEIGTDNTATTEADTELGEVVLANIPRATQEIDGKTAIITFFIPDMDLPEDEYHEFSLRAGSQFLARSIISPSYDKSEAEDILVEYHISLDNVE